MLETNVKNYYYEVEVYICAKKKKLTACSRISINKINIQANILEQSN